MRIRSTFVLAAAAVTCLALASPRDAHAQTVMVQQSGVQPVQQYQVQPVYPPGYGPAPGAGPQYTAPIYQETQPSYVPQSVAMSGPRVLKDWNEGDPIPAGYHPSTRVRKGFVIGGAVTFGAMYLLTALVATGIDAGCGLSNDISGSTSSTSCANALFVPVIGPFIQMGQCSGGSCGLGDFWLGFDGAVQGLGLAMFIYGLAAPSTVLVRNDLGYEKPKDAPKLSLTPLPILTPSTQGMGFVGTF